MRKFHCIYFTLKTHTILLCFPGLKQYKEPLLWCQDQLIPTIHSLHVSNAKTVSSSVPTTPQPSKIQVLQSDRNPNKVNRLHTPRDMTEINMTCFMCQNVKPNVLEISPNLN